MRLILCSASPRRRELLSRLGIYFEAFAPEVDETRIEGEPVRSLPLRLAVAKASAGLKLAARGDGEPMIALAADTVVSQGEVELGKPRDRRHAREILAQLSGRDHLVTTGVCVLAANGTHSSCAVDTKVWFRELTPAQLDWLASSGEGDDKAGGYALQGLAGAFIERIEGSVSNVVGLPLGETLDLLAAAGVPLPWKRAQP